MKTFLRYVLPAAATAALVAASAFGGSPNPMQAPSSATPGHAVAFGTQPFYAVDSGKAFPTGAIVGTSDTQTITGKSIDASEINSGVLSLSRLPALTSGTSLLEGDGSGRFANVSLGAGLSLVSGVLSNTAPGAVASVFGRTGAVVAASNDYTFAQIGSKPTTLSGYGITDALAVANNLSDLANAATARTNLGLAIGTNVQAWDADLDALSALSGTNTIYYRSGAGTWTAVTIGTGLNFSAGTLANSHADAVASVFGRTGAVVAASNDYTFAQIGSKPTTLSGYGITDGLVKGNNLSDLPSASTARTNIGLAIGTNVQAQNQDLQAIANLITSNKIYYRFGPGDWRPVVIGANLSFINGTLNAGGGGGALVNSFNTRTGDVVAEAGDYTFDMVGAAPATTSTHILYGDGSGGFSPVTIGSGLDFTAGTLSSTSVGGVTSVFGRTGAVVAASNDYTFAQIGSKPTTLSGYGITDALAAANNLSDLANAGTARTNLGLAIGTNVEAWDADLDALAALTGTNTIYYRSAANTWTGVTIGSGLSFSAGTLSNTASGAVSSVFGRTGAVVAAANDYAFNQLSGALGCSQLPAFTGDLTNSGCATTLASSGATPGTYGNASHVPVINVDAKGRITGASTQAISLPTDQLTATVAQPGFDPFFKATCVLSNSNKTCTPASGGGYNQAFGTIARYTGKYYFEAQFTSVSGFAALGVASALGHQVNGENQLGSAGQMAWRAVVVYGTLETQGVTITTIQGFVTGDRLSVAVDLDANLIWFRTNAGNWNNNGSADPATGVGGIDLRYAYSSAANHLLWPAVENGTTNAVSLYELAGDFTESVPSGYSAWGP